MITQYKQTPVEAHLTLAAACFKTKHWNLPDGSILIFLNSQVVDGHADQPLIYFIYFPVGYWRAYIACHKLHNHTQGN